MTSECGSTCSCRNDPVKTANIVVASQVPEYKTFSVRI